MCDEATLKKIRTLKSVSDCYQNQEMCTKVIDSYPHALEFVPKYPMAQEMCDKAVNRCFLVFNSIPDWYKTQEMCDRVIAEGLFSIIYCPEYI